MHTITDDKSVAVLKTYSLYIMFSGSKSLTIIWPLIPSEDDFSQSAACSCRIPS